MKTEKPTAPLLSVRSVAERLGVSTRTVRRILDSRSLAFHRIGRTVRIAPADLETYIRLTRES